MSFEQAKMPAVRSPLARELLSLDKLHLLLVLSLEYVGKTQFSMWYREDNNI